MRRAPGVVSLHLTGSPNYFSWCCKFAEGVSVMTDLQCDLCQKLHNLSASLTTWWRHQMETFSALLAFVRGIHRSTVNSPYKGQWRGALMFSLICVWINGWVNNREAGDLRHYRVHYDVTVMRNRHLFSITNHTEECCIWWASAK